MSAIRLSFYFAPYDFSQSHSGRVRTIILLAQNSTLHFTHFFRVSRTPSNTTDFVFSGFRKMTDLRFVGWRVYTGQL